MSRLLDDQPRTDVQLRKYQRLAVAFALTYRIDGSPVRAGRAHDIGGGGIALDGDVSLLEGAHIEIGFELFEGSKIEVGGRVTASHLDRATGLHLNRVAFEGISDGVQETIRGFVFQALRTALMNSTADEHPNSAVHLRQYQRLDVGFRLTYGIEGDCAIRLGHARDISAGGMHFDSQEPLSKGARVQMQFELRPDLKLEVTGTIVSSNAGSADATYEHRIAFDDIPADVRQSIRAFVYAALRSSLLR
jgi:c-di-GMP-binding flagellar brake protein YcgR